MKKRFVRRQKSVTDFPNIYRGAKPHSKKENHHPGLLPGELDTFR